jgi:hypothetical protein
MECEDRIDRIVIQPEFVLVGLAVPHAGGRRLIDQICRNAERGGELADLLFVEPTDWVAVDA